MLKMVWKAAPEKIILHTVIFTMQAILDFVCNVYFIKKAIEIFEQEQGFAEFMKWILILLVLGSIRSLASIFYFQYINERLDLKIQKRMDALLFEKARKIDLACYENPKYYNKFNRVLTNMNRLPADVVFNITSLFSFVLLSIILFSYMWNVDSVILLFGVCPIISSYIVGKNNDLKYKCTIEKTRWDRQKSYVDETIYQKDYIKELKLTNISNVLQNKFNEAAGKNVSIQRYYGIKMLGFSILEKLFSETFVFAGGCLYAMYRLFFCKDLQAAEFVVLINVIRTFNNRMNRALLFVNKAGEHSLQISDLKEFMDYECKMKDGIQECGGVEEIVFNGVAFQYQNSEGYALKNIDLTIRRGEKIAIVGYNGAGKTTLIKLLMRFYDVVEGCILYNGKNIKEYKLEQYRRNFAAVFQDFKLYALPIEDNIFMGDKHEPGDAKAKDALSKVGLWGKVNQFRNGLKTMLTKEFDHDGEVLSGGEGQKLAISRMYVKDFEIAILDEPSSALDPIAENEMYHTMFEAANTKTVIFISHRLSAAAKADKVVYMEKGTIVEQGTHNELMKQKGKYYQMFCLQAEAYNRSDLAYE